LFKIRVKQNKVIVTTKDLMAPVRTTQRTQCASIRRNSQLKNVLIVRIIWNTQTQYVGKMQILLSRYLTLAVHVITTSLYRNDKRCHPPALYNSSVQRRIFLWLLNCLRGWKWLPPRRSPPHPTKELRSNQKETKNTIKIAR